VTVAIAVIALAAVLAPAAGAQQAPYGAHLALGGAETPLQFVSGCLTEVLPDGSTAATCVDGAPRATAPVRVTAPASLHLRFDRVATQVAVRLDGSGTTRDLQAVREQEHVWRVDVPAAVEGAVRLQVFARGDGWDGAYLGTLEVAAPATAAGARTAGSTSGPLAATVDRLRARGRRIGLRIAAPGPRATAGRFTAYVMLGGRRVSTLVRGRLTGTRTVRLLLRRQTWRRARRHGRLVVRLSAGGQVRTRRLALPR